MDENLLGYLLDALDPDTHRQVEAYLRDHPEGRDRLEQLRRSLEPLAADRDPIDPPPGLVVRTLGLVAEYQCRRFEIPMAPPVLSAPLPAPTRGRWRRADLLVAAGVLLCLGLLIPPGVAQLRRYQARVACQENLHGLHQALTGYADQHHGRFPQVREKPGRNVLGIVLPMLDREGLGRGLSLECPAVGQTGWQLWSVDKLDELTPEEFEAVAPQLAGCYSYALGYRDASGRLYGYRQTDDGRLPLMADQSGPGRGNSSNHGGGQNVLYIDGSVQYKTETTVGVDGDDIFINRRGRPNAGVDRWDTSLGTGADHP